MKVIRIYIKDVLGISELELAPGGFTLLEGKNASGKTSTIAAILSAIGGGSDKTLIRKGASEGEVVIDLSEDGLEGPIRVNKKQTADGAKLMVTHPELGRLGNAQSYLSKLLPALTLSPVEFLLATEKKQCEMFFAALPLTITSEQIAAITGDPAHVASYKSACTLRHALDVLADVEKSQYDARTGVNAALKDKRSSLRELEVTVPADLSEPGEWSERVAELEQELVELTAEHTSAMNAATAAHAKEKQAAVTAKTTAVTEAGRAATQAVAELDAQERTELEAVRARFTAQREKMSGIRDASVAAARQAHEEDCAAADERLTAERDEVRLRFEPRQAALNEDLGTARARLEQEAGHAQTREILARMRREAEKLQANSERLTAVVQGVRDLRLRLTSELPIPGLEVKDGALYVDGVPFKRVNEARRIQIAVEVAMLKAGKAKLLLIDGGERLDSTSLELLRQELERTGVQAIVTRVTDGDFVCHEMSIADAAAEQPTAP